MIGDIELAKELIPVRYILITLLVSQFKVLTACTTLIRHTEVITKV